ncbi:MAG: histidine kinase, partial [Nitrospinae bacterium]|nr:histidine kinase [Nitrospinota bacterium]
DFAWNLGGNLYGSNPDAAFAETALSKIGFVLYMNTTLNQGHFRGRGRTTLVLPVLARDEEPEPTTQESMFNYVRLSDGGPARHQGPRSEAGVIVEVARRLFPRGPIPWDELKTAAGIRGAIGAAVPGFKSILEIDKTRKEFHIEGRVMHRPSFATPTGRAAFKAVAIPPESLEKGGANRFKLMTVRSDSQFNTVVYELHDKYRGVDSRDVVLMNPEDIRRLGLAGNARVTVRNATGALAGQRLAPYPVKAGNIMMYFPESNILVPRISDGQSKTPSFKSVDVFIERES